jgi:hypothetical protein
MTYSENGQSGHITMFACLSVIVYRQATNISLRYIGVIAKVVQANNLEKIVNVYFLSALPIHFSGWHNETGWPKGEGH